MVGQHTGPQAEENRRSKETVEARSTAKGGGLQEEDQVTTKESRQGRTQSKSDSRGNRGDRPAGSNRERIQRREEDVEGGPKGAGEGNEEDVSGGSEGGNGDT